MGDWLKWALVTIVQFVIGKRFYVAAGRALRNGSTNIDVLVVVRTTSCYVYSVHALLYGAKRRQMLSKSRRTDSTILLVKDKGGRVVSQIEIDALLTLPGDVLKVLPGAKVPVGGVVSDHVNKSMVTGESVQRGEFSSHWWYNQFTWFAHIQATNNTVLSQIISPAGRWFRCQKLLFM
ncbi:PREDICTED: copper-transporting ATPase RAN1-like [Nicotiana attenuata]|uniref:Copper-transporting atpase ran1 n=1 Tax=Nicotiana attenuata TaxID=49451 RepID=A0A314L8L7_NICAT|nr:PREDICTED: copper-transporting ATPase RAN1-like [Nicotiana attenuata]XP_019262980.1 PREDICTED: copper-transporting ATPase RAN1-like [Nicotiana attenuata]OIT37447.1 copper-transporting atpase ran1 [Nicotiana attenuata]